MEEVPDSAIAELLSSHHERFAVAPELPREQRSKILAHDRRAERSQQSS